MPDTKNPDLLKFLTSRSGFEKILLERIFIDEHPLIFGRVGP